MACTGGAKPRRGARPIYSGEWAGGAYQLVRDWLAPALLGRWITSARQLQDLLAPFKGNPFAKAPSISLGGTSHPAFSAGRCGWRSAVCRTPWRSAPISASWKTSRICWPVWAAQSARDSPESS